MDLFYDIFWTSVGAVLGIMLALHIFRRFTAPYRLHIYLKSGEILRISVKDFHATQTRLSWTHSAYVGQTMFLPNFDNMEAFKVVDRRYTF